MERWEVVLTLSEPIEEPMKAVRRGVPHWMQPGTRRACIPILFEIKGLEAGKQVDQGLEGRKELGALQPKIIRKTRIRLKLVNRME